MASVRQQILAYVKARLVGLAGFGGRVYLFDDHPAGIPEGKFPAIRIAHENEDSEDEAFEWPTLQKRTTRFTVSVFAKQAAGVGTFLDDASVAIQKALQASETVDTAGGLAVGGVSYRGVEDDYTVRSDGAMRLRFEAEYQVRSNAPDVPAVN